MTAPHTQLHELFEKHHQFRMKANPEFATYEGDHRYNHLLTDLSARFEDEQVQALRGFRLELEKIPVAALSPEDQLNHEMFAILLDESIEGAAFHTYQMPINQMTGYHLSLPQLIDFQPLNTAEHYPDYFARLRGFAAQADDVIENMRAGMASGRVQPRHLMEQVLPQIEHLIAMPQDSVFSLPLQQNSSLSEAERNSLQAELDTIIHEVINPTYQKMHDFVRDSYLPVCRETHGIWDLPDGEALYQYFIKMYTTPELNADEIHEMGLAEVERIHAEKARLKDELGYGSLSVQEFNQQLRNDPAQIFESKEALWAAYEAVMAEAYEKTPALVTRMPKAPCVLKEVEAYKAKSAPQAYYMPAPEDGSRPGYYYLNTYDLPSRPKYAVTALTLHEAIPGHHLQIALAQEHAHLPYFRRRMMMTAYIEGWGLYSEFLGHEMQMYNDPYQLYGALSFEMWRACRLVVDTGLHHKRWTRQQAIDFMVSKMSNSAHDIAAEVDRYMILPGQALSYKVGELKIKALRRQAEQALGERFRIQDFHEVVLHNGAVPLSVLDEQVQAWLSKLT